MTNPHEVQCPQCQQTFRDEETLRGHGLREHAQTRQQHQQQHADVVTQQKQQSTDRQQDVAGRRESAGQPSDPDAGGERPGSERSGERMNAGAPGEAIGQQTQRQQRQVQ
ncbi:MAG: hypothetical protein WCI61_01565 [Chloroflexota bacterium]